MYKLIKWWKNKIFDIRGSEEVRNQEGGWFQTFWRGGMWELFCHTKQWHKHGIHFLRFFLIKIKFFFNFFKIFVLGILQIQIKKSKKVFGKNNATPSSGIHLHLALSISLAPRVY